MKIIKFILFFVFGISSLTFAQTLNTNLHEATSLKPIKNNLSNNPNLIYLDKSKTIDLPVDGAFLYSSLDPESGVIASGYNNNEDYIVTIKNQYNRLIFLRSHYFSTENKNDVLTIYDGRDTTALELKSLSGYLDENFAIMSTGEYLTLRFKSNNSTTSKGFRFRLDNGPGVANKPASPLPNPMACASTPAANECVNAPLICDLNGYCGNTSGSYTAGNTSGLGNFCGSIENNSWLSFVASGTSASLGFNSGGCQDNSAGIQAVIYASSNCTSFTEVSNCESQGGGSGTFTITTNVNLVPGQTYYVMVDGFAGNVCNYTVTAQAGVALGQQITGPNQLCPGGPGVLGASSTASSYSWTSSPAGVYPNTQTITITPTVTTTYTLTMGPSACTPTGITIVKTVTVTNTLNPANITAPPLVCLGSNVSLTSLTNGGTYVWAGPAGFNSNVQSPTVNNWTAANNGTYSLTINYGGGCSTLPATVNISGVAAPVVNIAASSQTICAGQSATLTASGGTGANPYNWNWNLLHGTIVLQSCAIAGFPASCVNNPVFSLFPGLSSTGPKAVVTPNQTTQYCASFENATGCIGTRCVTITVLPAAGTITVSPTTTICPGQSSTLTATGGTTYTWTPAATLNTPNGGTVIATPASTTNYTVTTPACAGTQSAAVQVVVNGTPPAIGAISGSTLICPNSTGITYSVANVASTNYTWSVPAGATITSAPTNSNAITVNFGSSAGTVSVIAVGTCGSATAAINVSISPALNLTVTPNTSTVCAGSSSTLTASGATNYTWSPAGSLSSASGTNVLATPTITTVYTIIGSTGTCTGSTTSTVTVGGALTLTVTPSTSTVCPGTPVTLTASGATNYTWSPSATLSSANGTTVTATPSVNTTYTVLGATGTCTGTATAIVTIGGSLTLTVTPNTSTVCAGTPVVLTASGATNYTWSPSATLSSANGATVTATPLANTTYTVIGASGTCTGSATANISMSGPLTLTLTSNTPTVCVTNPSALLDVNGATTYTWFPSATLSAPNGPNVTASPLVNTTYTVLGSTGTCTGVATINIGIGVCVSSACNLALIRSTLTAAGNIELLGMNNTCSLYFINPQFMTGPQAQAYAQTFGANLISVQSATENADLVQALSNQGYAGQVIWIGYSDAITEGSFVWYDGAPLSYSNWAPGEPNNSGGVEHCTQIYPDGSWNDLNCAGYNSLSVIEVNICPQVSVVNVPPTHCPFTNVTMNASTLLGSPNYTYTWAQSGADSFTTTSTGSSLNDQITVTSTGANTFTVFTEDRYSCPQSTTVSLNVFPTPTITANTATICAGQQTATLTANGATTYSWIPGTGLSSTSGAVVTGTPGSTQNYTVIGMDANGCMNGTVTAITVNPLPTVTVNSSTICVGQQTATLIANGTTSYSWTPAIGLSATSGSLVTGNPLTTQDYTLTGTDANGCFANATATITVNSLPTITVNSSTICVGQQTATLTANGATTYSWIPGTGLSATTGAVVTGTPSSSQNYTVAGMDANGCISGTTTAINVNPLPIITVNSATICAGQQTATLTANGATTYSWIPGTGLSATTGAVVTGTPGATQNYTVGGIDANGCINGTVTAITVNPLPNVTVNSASICIGQQTATLIANGASTYTWNPAVNLSSSSGTTVTGTPAATENYTITGEDANGCFNTATSTITVNSLPTITATSSTICVGQQTATLTAAGATTYSWIPGTGLSATTGAVVTGTPNATQNYTVAGMDANGCISGTVTAITVNPLPSVTATSATICVGQQTATLTASGATTYSWIPGTGLSATTGSVVTGTPTVTQNYTVAGIDANGCINGTITAITVNPLPTITVSPDMTVCPLSANTLTASGASSYTWTPNIFLNNNLGANIICTPSVTTTYTIDGTSAASCTNTAVMTIAVQNTVVVTASASTPTICPLASTSLTATGATTYTWSPSLTLSSANGASVTAAPATTTTYTVIGSTSTCTNSAQVVVTLTVNPTLTVTPSPSVICSGNSSALTANGASTYTWSPSATLSSSNGAAVNASPTVTTVYNISGTSQLGCLGSTTTTVTVVATPTLNVTSSPGVICANSSSTLSAFGATNYTWSPSANLSSVNSNTTIATPPLTTTFTVFGTNGVAPFLCPDTKTVQVTVIPNPTLTPSPGVPICEGQSTLMYATGANTYTWSPTIGVSDVNDSTTSVRPPLPGVYIYTVTGTTNNCTGTATVEITVNALPVIDAGLDSTINIDETITLIASGNTPVGFINASTGVPLDCNYCPTVTVNPQENTCYTIEGISSFGCRNTDVVCITVTKDWDVFIPNAFTPNGDINNEVFAPKGYGIDKIRLTIFDRWGHQLFNEEGQTVGWDGTYKGKICEQGVYIFKLEVTAMSGEKRYKTGHVTLLGKVK